MKFFNIALSSIFLLFCGCSALHKSPEKELEEKKIIYQNINNEIDFLKTRGEKSLESGHYAEAAKDFKMVNYYSNAAVIPVEKIKHLESKAKTNTEVRYEKGMRLLAKNKKEALIEFNIVVQNKSDYKDAKEQLKKLLADKEIISFIASLEKNITLQIKEGRNSLESLAKLSKASANLLQYDYENKTALGGKEHVKQQEKALTDGAISLYNAQKFDAAKKHFTTIKEIYGDSVTTQKYLDMLNTSAKINAANNSLKQKNYPLAIKQAKNILENSPGNTQASNILKTASKNYQAMIPDLLAKGIDDYKKQNLNSALKNFQSILDFDPDNPTAKIYIKKVTKQIETIQKLK
jgi:hypothetical protein